MLVAIHDRSSDNQGTSNQSFAEHTLCLERHQIQTTTTNTPLHDSNGRRQRTVQVNLMAFSFCRIPLLTYLTVCQTVCYTLRSHIPSLHWHTLWYIIRAYTLLPDLYYQAARSNA